MKPRTLSKIAGISYLVIFFAAIFANFFVLETILKSSVETIQQNQLWVRLGIVAFLVTVLFDVVVAWALYQLYITHPLSGLSTYFRMMHAAIMAVGIFALTFVVDAPQRDELLHHAATFNAIWLIGLFFFGAHLILLGRILKKPDIIAFFLMLAGIMYMVDTLAHFLIETYESYGSIFLVLVAIPSIVGEMSLALWLLIKGGKQRSEPVNP